MKILIADDDLVSRRLLEGTLLRLGYEVVAVADGQQAVDELTRTAAPQLAILDWMMPGVDGLAACQMIRRRAESPYVYIILLTARDGRRDKLTALDAGADEFLTKPLDHVELRARLRSGRRILELQAGLLAAQEALRLEATRDHLTGLWNRRMIVEQLHRELRRARHERRPLAIALADVDHFKAVNDRYGHEIGDEVLRDVAQRMQSVVRDYDFLGRYGGEEFLVVLPGCDQKLGTTVAERLRRRVAAEPLRVGNLCIEPTISLGVAWTNGLVEEPAVLIKAADLAMYTAKSAGRNRVHTA